MSGRDKLKALLAVWPKKRAVLRSEERLGSATD
jgi:hypothetical protein